MKTYLRITNIFKVNVLGEDVGEYFSRTIHNVELLKTYPDIYREMFFNEVVKQLKRDPKINGRVFQAIWFCSDFAIFDTSHIEITKMENDT